MPDKEYWHNKGQEDASNGRSDWSGPWRQPFESEKSFDEREEAYQKGRENAE